MLHLLFRSGHLLLAFFCVVVRAIGNDDLTCAAAPEDAQYANDPPCYFPTIFLEVPVKAIREETHDSKVITFGLPEGVSLNLPVSSAILMNAKGAGKNGKDIIRPYNPISPNSVTDSFDLLIKVYPDGKASKFAGDLKVGDRVGFKQTKHNIKDDFQYPFDGIKKITMLAGGTGIAPMFQALHPILARQGDEIEEVRLLYGNKSPDDIMLKAELDLLAKEHADRFTVYYVVGEEEFDDRAEEYGFEGGWIDEEKIKRLAFSSKEENSIVWVCGVDAMYNALAGSRNKPLAPGSALKNLGYKDHQVWRS